MFEIADPNAPVFVQLIAHGTARNLALPPHGERALVVGSTRDADFQVNGLRVAPVQFHLERDNGAVWLIPAYSIRDLRLNGAAVVGPTPLEEHNIVLFAGVHLEVTIRDENEFVASGDSLFTDPPSRREFRASYSMELPSEYDATHLAMTPVPTGSPDDEWPTVDGESVAAQSAMEVEQTTQRIVPFRAASTLEIVTEPEFTLYGTEIIPRTEPQPRDSTPAAFHSQPATIAPVDPSAAQGDPLRLKPLQLIPLSNAPRPQPVPPRPTARIPASRQDSVTSPDETPNTRAAVAPPPLGRHPLLLAEDAAPPRLRMSSVQPPKVATRRPSFLTRLGLLTKARPLLVGCCTGFGAALLCIGLLAVTRMTAPRRAHPATGPTALVTTLSALQPDLAARVPDAPRTPVGTPASVASSAQRSSPKSARSSIANSPRTETLH
jgi:hypothetical protein